ncbi:alcohol dehydrogenase catalytic domain-containing protein [Palleronia sp.]|uniref:alcohol dehydrogenase catalytic domain-containing protein n=1 Tax=Palleronia sp. TaxID=1940284 RepID=UPI0035C7F40E
MSLAIRIHEFGASDVLTSEEIDTPEPGFGELRILVHAASVNPVDYKIRRGAYPLVSADDLPITMGRDVSGVYPR